MIPLRSAALALPLHSLRLAYRGLQVLPTISRAHSTDVVRVDDCGSGVKKITLNDPDKLNALSVSMGQEFSRVVRDLRQSPSTRAVVLTGAGRAFSAGGDLDWLLERTCVTTHSAPRTRSHRPSLAH